MAFQIRDGKFLIGSDGAFSTNEDCCCGADPCNCTTYVMPVQSITRSGTTATVTTTDPHHLNVGDSYGLTIAGAVETAYNGGKSVTVTSATQFTYTVAGSPATPATGTITATYAGPACTDCGVCAPAVWTVAPSGITLCTGCVPYFDTFSGVTRYFKRISGDPTATQCVPKSNGTACLWERDVAAVSRIYTDSGCTTQVVFSGDSGTKHFVRRTSSTEIEFYIIEQMGSFGNWFDFYAKTTAGCTSVTLENELTGSCGDPVTLVGVDGFVMGTGGTVDLTPCCEEGI
jgi:hypothetical protein